jgi:DNA-binding response OmpR family regulator
MARADSPSPADVQALRFPAGARPGLRPASASRVLIVEDDLQLCTLVAEFLRDEGFVVDTAATGPEGLERIVQQPPTLVLLDIHLPGMPGWELVAHLRTRGIAVPIIVMTAAQDAPRWAREIGAISYIPKPVSLPALVRRLDALAA